MSRTRGGGAIFKLRRGGLCAAAWFAVAVFAFAMLVLQACNVPYNPSFARKTAAKDNSARAPATNGYGTFLWNITFPAGVPIKERSYFRLKYMPESPNELDLDGTWNETWLDPAQGSVSGSEEIPAGLYFLELYLGAKYSYAAKFDLFRVQRGMDNSFNVTFRDADFIPYTLVNVNLTLTSDVPVTFSAAHKAKVTLYIDEDRNGDYETQVPSIDGQPEIELAVTALGVTVRASQWMALPDENNADNVFSSDFLAKLDVTDANGKTYRRTTTHNIVGQSGAININPTPLLRRIAVNNIPANGGAVSFSQGGAIGGAGYDPEGGEVTVTVRGAGGYGLETINVSDGTLNIVAEDTFRFSDMPTANVNVIANWVQLSGYVCELLPDVGITSNHIGYRRYAELSGAVGNATTGTVDSPNVIRILQNIDLNSAKIIDITQTWSGDKHIKLTVPSGATKTLKRTGTGTGAFFAVRANSSLTLEGSGAGQIILDGGAVWTGGTVPNPLPADMMLADFPSPAFGAANTGLSANGPLVYAQGGALTMKTGAVLRNNDKRSYADGNAVAIISNGTFAMSGGRIINNMGGVGGYSAGVFVDMDCNFTMSGGNISGNKNDANNSGGGVHNQGNFIMQDGIISGNNASGGGGMIQGGAGSTLMSGGEISGNTAGGGGGVEINNGTFTLQLGKISGNTAGVGGGVQMHDGYDNIMFIMQGGEISGNTAGTEEHTGDGGGGVNIANYRSNLNAVFDMQGGIIKNNTATGRGTGVNFGTQEFRHPGDMFKMSGGAVIASNNDVYLPSDKTITIAGALTGTAPVATITPETPAAGTQVLGESAAGLIAANYGKFALDPALTSARWRIINNGTLTQTQPVSWKIRLTRPIVTPLTYNNYNDFTTAFNNATGTDNIIEIASDGNQTINIASRLEVNKKITIKAYSGNITLKRANSLTTNVFAINSGGALTLGDAGAAGMLYIDGNKEANIASCGSLIVVNGNLTLNNNAVLQNNKAASTISGGAVCLNSGAFFEMTGGKIYKNEAYDGGGVMVNANARFTMTGGEIAGNVGTGGGVHTQGEFICKGGTIYGSGSGANANNSAAGPAQSLYRAGAGTAKYGNLDDIITAGNYTNQTIIGHY